MLLNINKLKSNPSIEEDRKRNWRRPQSESCFECGKGSEKIVQSLLATHTHNSSIIRKGSLRQIKKASSRCSWTQ